MGKCRIFWLKSNSFLCSYCVIRMSKFPACCPGALPGSPPFTQGHVFFVMMLYQGQLPRGRRWNSYFSPLQTKCALRGQLGVHDTVFSPLRYFCYPEPDPPSRQHQKFMKLYSFTCINIVHPPGIPLKLSICLYWQSMQIEPHTSWNEKHFLLEPFDL